MFRFFKINDPYRLIAIFLIALAIKLPFVISDSSFFEMYHWLIIGEAMQYSHLYFDIFDSISPLAATFYWLIFSLFGKSTLVLHILGGLLLVVQAIIFNNLTIQNKVYSQNTYLPAFTFLIISSVHYSLSVFSPVQLGITFILLALSKLLSHVEFRAKRDEHIMSIGLLTGFGSLFYLPLITFLPVILIILLIFTSTVRRRYVILLFSALLPLVLTFFYYWLVNGMAGYFINNFFIPALEVDFSFFTNFSTYWLLLIPSIILLVLGFVTIARHHRLNNYQNRLVQLFIITGFLMLSLMIFKGTTFFAGYGLLVPVCAYFATHLFFLISRALTDLFISLLFVTVILVLSYDNEFGFIELTGKLEQADKYEPELVSLISGERLMILGDDRQLYRYGSLATPFYTWSLALPIVDNLNYYDNLVFISESVEQFKPTMIIDKEERWQDIIGHIPHLKTRFTQIRPGIWQRIKE